MSNGSTDVFLTGNADAITTSLTITADDVEAATAYVTRHTDPAETDRFLDMLGLTGDQPDVTRNLAYTWRGDRAMVPRVGRRTTGPKAGAL